MGGQPPQKPLISAARRPPPAARDIVSTAARHTPLHTGGDPTPAVCTASSSMPAAGETIFAVALTAGWIAHTLEEYGERPLPMRLSGVYVGARPPQPLA